MLVCSRELQQLNGKYADDHFKSKKFRFFFYPSSSLLSPHIFVDGSVFVAVLLPCFELYLSVMRHIFADGPVLGYVCPCCVRFLLMAQFWGIFVRSASHFC